MAKRQTDLDIELSNAMRNWTCINRGLDPIEWKSWIDFRREYIGSRLETDNLTVPTPFPPTTDQAIQAYLDVIKLIRRINGWNGPRGPAKILPFRAK